MSILIKDMEMPKSCAECRFCGEYCYAKGDENKHSKLPCPLVSVPPHGRLIDADVFTELMFNDPYQNWVHILSQLPAVIIPASGGNENE